MRPTFAMALLFALSIGIGFAISMSFPGEEVTEPTSYSNVPLFLIPFGLVTAIFLILIKIGKDAIIFHMVMAVSWVLLWLSFDLLFSLILDYITSVALSLGLTILLLYLFYFSNARIWAKNTMAVVVGGGAMGILGTIVDVPPLILILIVLAVYDGIAVYKTKHMFEIAERAIEGDLPLLLSLPKGGDKTGTMMMGLGDVVFPGTLVISANIFVGPAAAAMVLVGIGAGMALLFRAISRRGQAGLLFLNTGGIAGYLFYVLFSSFLSFP